MTSSSLSVPVVSSDSDSDSDLSSSSLEDRPMPSGVKDTKGDKPRGDSGKCGEISCLFPEPEVLSGFLLSLVAASPLVSVNCP